jgi:hypothetical protein
MRALLTIAAAFLVLAALAACAPTPEGIARVKAEQQAFYRRTFLPGAPKPGDPAYVATACGGDHGMAEQWFDDRNGYPRIGPPKMSVCR